MTVQELIAELREKAKNVNIQDDRFLAVQINVKDRDPGVFYVEVKDRRINIEPYEYNDRNCAITMKMNDLIKLLEGRLDAVAAFTLGKLRVDGDIGKALEFSELIKQVS